MHTTQAILDQINLRLAEQEQVQSIGISAKTLPQDTGQGDIDIFLYCDAIPGRAARQTVMESLNDLITDCTVGVFEGGHWGTGDFARINGIDAWFMYFSMDEAVREVESILAGAYPDRLGGYYPIGRCAMLQTIHVLVDKHGFLACLKTRLSDYPEQLAGIMITHHLRALEDTEDLERAVARRDVLFYHTAIDEAIDHFLQALFALNRTFFPSRKRTPEYLSGFEIQPDGCGQRLLEVVRLGGYSEGMAQSYALWQELTAQLTELSL